MFSFQSIGNFLYQHWQRKLFLKLLRVKLAIVKCKMKIETYFVSLKLLPNAATFNLHLSERDIENGL